MRILVAEDEKRLARVLRQGLEEDGYAVDVVHDGGQASELALATDYDCMGMATGMPGRPGVTLGADKGYDTRGFVEELRILEITPHVAAKVKHSAIDGRTTRHAGYATSQKKRKRVEEILGWLKTIALLRKTRHRGKERVGWMLRFSLAVYNLVRIRNLAWGPA